MSETDGISDLDPSTAALDGDVQSAERLDADKWPEELPERPIAAFEHGTTEREMREGETMADRLDREEPDTPTAGPLDTAATPLADDADEDGLDREKDMVAELPITEPHLDDTAQPDPPAPAEEQAVRIDDEVPGATDHQVVREDPLS